MDLSKTVIVLLVFLVTLQIRVIQPVIVRPYCFERSTGYNVMIRLLKNESEDESITGLQAYDASIDPLTGTPVAATDAGCITPTSIPETSNVYALSFDFDTGSSTCGSDGVTVLIRGIGTYRFWEFTCSGPNVISNELSNNVIANGQSDYHHHLPNPFGIKFQAFEADGSHTPVTSVHLRQDIKLRLIYNVGEMETGPDNWGMVFHAGFVPHATATGLLLEIVTPGFGTKVHITGVIGEPKLDLWAAVKRDSAAEIRIPAEYLQSDATYLDWTIKSRGIKIEAMHDRIGVRAISENGDGSSFIVLPDSLLGTHYLGLSLLDEASPDGEVLIVAAEDSTQIDIVYNNFGPRDGLEVNGIAADFGTSTENINLNEHDVLHIRCNTSCYQLVFYSDKPFGVIFGADDKPHFRDTINRGHVSTQLLPVTDYDDYFVFVPEVTSFTPHIIGQHIDQTDDTDYGFFDYYDGGNIIFYNNRFLANMNSEIVTTIPIGCYLHLEAGGAEYDPALFPIPSVNQYGAYNYFYAKEGPVYTIIIAGEIGDVANIKFKSGVATNLVGSKLGDQPGFSTTTIGDITSKPKNYEKYTFDIIVSDTSPKRDQGLIEFTGASPAKTFLMIIQEENGSHRNMYLPFGVRYPPSNPCQPTELVRPGDLLNNDCDDYTDEEISNGLDDDGDGRIDEDTAVDLVNLVTGIFVKELWLCRDAECSTSRLVQTFGCYDYYDTYRDTSYLGIGPFRHNTDLADEFDNYYVIETSEFDVFKYIDDVTIYFSVKYGLCLGNLTTCENTCLENDDKRSIDEDNRIMLALPVIRNTSHPQAGERKGPQKPHPCSNNPVFWVTMILLLVILFVEVVATMFISCKWYQFRRQLYN